MKSVSIMDIAMEERESARALSVLAYGSKGGHWDQLMLLRSAFDGVGVMTFATTDVQLASAYDVERCVELRDYSRSKPLAILMGFAETFALVYRLRPDVLVSTGAAPGLLLLLWARVFGAHTIWIDSIANAEKLSLSGSLARFCANRVVTQWQHLASDGKAEYWGSVL